jgi:hypothetical protein
MRPSRHGSRSVINSQQRPAGPVLTDVNFGNFELTNYAGSGTWYLFYSPIRGGPFESVDSEVGAQPLLLSGVGVAGFYFATQNNAVHLPTAADSNVVTTTDE